MRLIDADALDKRVLTTTYTEQNMWALNLLSEYIREAPTIGGWISVKDRMPMLIETVLFIGKRYDGGWFGTKRGYFDGTCWYADDEGTIYSTTPVTHWMPLPEPPEEVSE